jgi:hypothetical protein
MATILDVICDAATLIAERGEETSFSYILPTFAMSPFVQHRDDVLAELKRRLPDCSVTYTFIAMDKKGKRYDLSKVDPATKKTLDLKRKAEAVMIDWSC